MSRLICVNCGPREMWANFGSKTHVLCLKCGIEVPRPNGDVMSRYDYVKYDDKAAAAQADFKAAFIALDKMVDRIENGRARALIYTKLEEAYMWVGKALRDEQTNYRSADLQESRGNS